MANPPNALAMQGTDAASAAPPPSDSAPNGAASEDQDLVQITIPRAALAAVEEAVQTLQSVLQQAASKADGDIAAQKQTPDGDMGGLTGEEFDKMRGP